MIISQMQLLKLIFFTLSLVTFVTPLAYAQFFEVCQKGSVDELIRNIKAHSEHTYRRDYKFHQSYYLQTNRLPPGVELARLHDVLGFLDDLERAPRPRKAAVLFYAYCQGKLCTWLLPPSSGRLRSHLAQLKEEEFRSIRPNLMNALMMRGKVNRGIPVPRGGVRRVEVVPSPIGVNRAPEVTRSYLLPGPISQGLVEEKIDTLVVVPISDIGTIPFAALPFRDKSLVDYMSVVIAPGFFAFQKKPEKSQHVFSPSIIAGDPEGNDEDWEFPLLPGARAEAMEIARSLRSEALIGKAASKENIRAKLLGQSRTGLIYLAAHGIADPKNPLDGSFLFLSDGRWTAREMKDAPLKGGRPLVVMSACQTGLGKDFDAGTIGMARAWLRAGASSVVMSLWNVDDAATRKLMVNFMGLAEKNPPDKALQEAMQAVRKEHYDDPALWAGFTVFGSPELW